MQGSETPLAIVVIDEKAMRLCDRAWIYTAISRAKEKCIIIGRKSVADMMCRQVNIGKRKTFLRELLQLENAKRSLELL
jgi:ATP-dependent exoDNAse (exonuclease V) alpha subunit